MAGSLGRVAVAARAATTLASNRGPAAGGVVLAYHDVFADGATCGELGVSAGLLRNHVRWLRRLGFQLVTVDHIVTRLLSGHSVDRLAALTFDDALVGVHRHGLPVLAEEQVPATVFVVTGTRGRGPKWWPGAAPTMTDRQLIDLVEAGVSLAPHTRTHRSLPTLAPAEIDHEVATSRAVLQDLAGQDCDVLAYPFGHHDATVRLVVADAGFRAGFTYVNGRLTGIEDRFKLPRLTMGPEMSRLRLALQLGRSPRSWPDHQLDVVGASSLPWT